MGHRIKGEVALIKKVQKLFCVQIFNFLKKINIVECFTMLILLCTKQYYLKSLLYI